MRNFLQIVAAIGLIFTIVGGAAGQRPNRNAPPAELPGKELKGKVAGVRPGMIAVEAEDGQYHVQIVPRETAVVVTGTAEAEFLRPGLFVRFSATLEKDQASAPVEELTIIAPSDQNPPGVFSEGDNPTDTSGPSTVVGQVKSFKKGRLQVTVPPKRLIRAELTESPKLDVNVSDYSIVSVGDAIEVRGKQPGPGQVIADHVAIELAEPLVTAAAKRKAASRGRDFRRRGGANRQEQPQRDAPEPEAGKNEPASRDES